MLFMKICLFKTINFPTGTNLVRKKLATDHTGNLLRVSHNGLSDVIDILTVVK